MKKEQIIRKSQRKEIRKKELELRINRESIIWIKKLESNIFFLSRLNWVIFISKIIILIIIINISILLIIKTNIKVLCFGFFNICLLFYLYYLILLGKQFITGEINFQGKVFKKIEDYKDFKKIFIIKILISVFFSPFPWFFLLTIYLKIRHN